MYKKFSRKSIYKKSLVYEKFSKNFLCTKNSVESLYVQKIQQKVSYVQKIQQKVYMYVKFSRKSLRTKNLVKCLQVTNDCTKNSVRNLCIKKFIKKSMYEKFSKKYTHIYVKKFRKILCTINSVKSFYIKKIRKNSLCTRKSVQKIQKKVSTTVTFIKNVCKKNSVDLCYGY